MASIEQRGNVWTVRWRNRNSATNHRLRFRSEREALRRKVEIEDAIDRFGRWDLPREGDAPARLSEVIGKYLAEVARRKAPRTAVNVARAMDLYQRFAGDPYVTDGLTYSSLSDFETWLRQPENSQRPTGRKTATIVGLVGIVETFWKWAWVAQERNLDPIFRGIRPSLSLELKRDPSPYVMAPSWHQMDACIEASNGWRRNLHFVLRCTGLRVYQVMRLLWSDLDMNNGVLLIRPELGKTRAERRGRSVPVARVLLDELAGWGTREGFIIHYPFKNRLMGLDTDSAVRAWERAKVDPAVWKNHPHHCFRAGFFTGLRRAGADKDAIQHLVGHSRGAVTEAYDDPHSPALLKAVGLVPELHGVKTNIIQLEQK